jgi:methionyl-tRNA formyltransferase
VFTPQSADVPVYQEVLVQYKPAVAVTLAFGQFLRKSFLESLSRGCVNVHYSLLPVLRGAVPVQMAIMQGLRETGVTVQLMEETMDTGPILSQEKVPIGPRETTPSLKDILIPVGCELLMKSLPGWVSGQLQPVPQDDSHATYCYMHDISKEKAQIPWKTESAEHIDRMVRALLPWPVAWTILPDGTTVKIFEAHLERKSVKAEPGDIVAGEKQLMFATLDAETILNATIVQPAGKNKMSGEEFLRGSRLTAH